jgi:hypothetical protein
MKTNSMILVLFAIIFNCGQIWAQDNLPYRPFKTFNKDTIRYLDYNFTIRADQYEDKTVGNLFYDLELPIVYVSDLIMQAGGDKSGIYIIGMNLVIRPVRDGSEGERDSKDYYIRIRLKAPVYAGDFVDALHVDKRNKGRNELYYWTSELYEVLKDFKLEFIETNYLLFKDRRKLLETNRKEDIEQLRKIIKNEKENWRQRIRAEKRAIDK